MSRSQITRKRSVPVATCSTHRTDFGCRGTNFRRSDFRSSRGRSRRSLPSSQNAKQDARGGAINDDEVEVRAQGVGVVVVGEAAVVQVDGVLQSHLARNLGLMRFNQRAQLTEELRLPRVQ
jgi:hypothetical protein